MTTPPVPPIPERLRPRAADTPGPAHAPPRPPQAKEQPPLVLVSAADLFAGSAPGPIDYVVAGVPAGELLILAGGDGVGKSTLKQQIAVGVAAGIPIAGGAIPAPAQTGRVVIIEGEDDIDRMHRRLRALRAEIAADPAGGEVLERFDAGMRNLGLVALDGMRLPLMVAGRQDEEPRENQRAIDALLRVCEGSRLVFLDPLVMYHSVSENDNGHMDNLARFLIRIARRIGAETGCAIGVSHHMGQEAGRSARDDHQAGRGATSFAAASRCVLTLRRLNEREHKAAKDANRDPLILRHLRGPKVSRQREEAGVMLTFTEGWVCAALAAGADPARLEADLTARATRKGRHAADYARRTVRHAMAAVHRDPGHPPDSRLTPQGGRGNRCARAGGVNKGQDEIASQRRSDAISRPVPAGNRGTRVSARQSPERDRPSSSDTGTYRGPGSSAASRCDAIP